MAWRVRKLKYHCSLPMYVTSALTWIEMFKFHETLPILALVQSYVSMYVCTCMTHTYLLNLKKSV